MDATEIIIGIEKKDLDKIVFDVESESTIKSRGSYLRFQSYS